MKVAASFLVSLFIRIFHSFSTYTYLKYLDNVMKNFSITVEIYKKQRPSLTKPLLTIFFSSSSPLIFPLIRSYDDPPHSSG
ncbi:hypothetical protein Gste01_01221 [Geobacillus stearothermophilus ATCC 7953]